MGEFMEINFKQCSNCQCRLAKHENIICSHCIVEMIRIIEKQKLEIYKLQQDIKQWKEDFEQQNG